MCDVIDMQGQCMELEYVNCPREFTLHSKYQVRCGRLKYFGHAVRALRMVNVRTDARGSDVKDDVVEWSVRADAVRASMLNGS